MRIKLILLGGVLGALILVGMAMNLRAQSTVGNVTGWAWGGTTDNAVGTVPLNIGGGVQQNCGTHTPPNCAPTLSNASGVGWISLSNVTGGGATPYGLTVPAGNGDARGYAWSERIGWINFDPAGPYPNCAACPATDVQRVNNKLVGWARVESINIALHQQVTLPNGAILPNNSGNWEGWIEFSPSYTGTIGGTQYAGVEIRPQGSGSTREEIRGYAWSNELGWIVFGGLTSGNPIVTYGGGGGGGTSPPTCVPPQVLLQNGTCGTPPPAPTCVAPQVLQNGVCVTLPPSSSLRCLPTTQTVLRNQPANFTATGGTGNFVWNAPNSTHLTGVGSTFTTTYIATGTYQVTVTSGSANAQCRVNVPVFIEVPP